ncbi:cytochrome P450 [Streptomyces lincolnensis]|uniref:Cytochrome P450 n=1 Tax=Streptomyces lincolnensis TaxID=1915 RepID=A0A1B1MLH6_STRLN|nr:cytochrome P450 [Streptomyces lincolnensis]ANS69461.1 cytochrome P450 [Streptomyces lincolnensis]AXG58380.1 cytochrome P450 [Streptomyces lincolnensis]QMV11033.1 cytochrome [Streptomyces lincolnensis]
MEFHLVDEGESAPGDDAPLEALAPEPLLTRDYETRPALVYERLRQRHGPVAPVDLLGVPAWLVLGYKESLQVLQEDAAWPKGLENWRARTEGRVPADWPLGPSLEVNHVLIQGGPGYPALRSAWDTALRPFQDPRHPQAKRLKAAVTVYADDLITLLAQGGRTGMADLSAQFSRPLPLMAASHLLGFPGSQGDDALMDMWRVLDAGPDAEPALERLLETLMRLAAAKMERPGDDFPSHLLAAHPDLSVDALARELFMLLGMTSDHVGILISNTVVEVISGESEGGVRAALSAGMVRETMNRVVMRKPPLVNFVPRFAARDTRLGNYTIRAGDPVWVSSAAAHADPLFAGQMAPGSTLSSRAHLSWGAGPRQCPARELASVTIAAAGVGRLFERFGHLELALPVDQLPWRSSPFMRGLRSLPVRYELASATVPPLPVPEEAVAAATGVPDQAEKRRSSLWRYLTGLIRSGG